jgi:hypothetical protein
LGHLECWNQLYEYLGLNGTPQWNCLDW